MYAVIASGGKQSRVSEGQQVHVELLDAEQGSEVSLTPVLVVDGDTVLATPAQLKGASQVQFCRSRPVRQIWRSRKELSISSTSYLSIFLNRKPFFLGLEASKIAL